MRPPRSLRPGVTLVELIVVLAILGLMAGVVGLSAPHTGWPTETDPWTAAIEAAREAAIDSGRTVTIALRVRDSVREATALPDGSVIVSGAPIVDRLSGIPLRAAHRGT